MTRVSEASSVCRVPAGTYWIGNDAIPNASPRHVRRFATDVWIDRVLVAWRDFEAFVGAGGYSDAEWWRTADGRTFPAAARPGSVDARCEAVRAATLAAAAAGPPGPRRDLPVLGLSWFEAAAVCRFFGARLPFEAEWETAVTEEVFGAGVRPAEPPHQEWCLDTYASRYWRADSDLRGHPWQPDKQVVVRGHAASEPDVGPTARRAAEPLVGAAERGFRRAWDRRPGG